jgi:hypothetical protein
VIQEAYKAMDYVLGKPTQVIRSGKQGKAGRYGELREQLASKATIPQRQFLMFQEDDIDDILQIFAEWMEDEARKVGRFTGMTVKRSGIDLLGGF